jgi:hypothetical protein
MESLQHSALSCHKVRNLNFILNNKLDGIKINAILRYLERSKKIEIDLEGNIIWISGQGNNQVTLADKAKFSFEFTDYLKSRSIYLDSSD